MFGAVEWALVAPFDFKEIHNPLSLQPLRGVAWLSVMITHTPVIALLEIDT